MPAEHALERGFFLTLEGVDGAGKSTLAKSLCARLQADGEDVVLTREPGGSAGAEEIRRLLVEGDPDRWSPRTELLLFNAARADHVEKLIRPALSQGSVVVSDRYVDSTRAYQSAGRGAALEDVDALHNRMIRLDPDLTLILDLDPAVAESRQTGAEKGEDRFERFGGGFQFRLRDAFLSIAENDPSRCVVLDAGASTDALADAAFAAVSARRAELSST